MLKNFKLVPKLLTIGIFLTLLPLLAITVFNYFQNRNINTITKTETEKIAYADLENIVKSVKTAMRTQQIMLEQQLNSSLKFARSLVQDQGGISLGQAGKEVKWTAINQFTKEATSINLPEFLVGQEWLGQTSAMTAKVPVVDQVQEIQGVTATIFQRMNDTGDMLRVATNVMKTDGSRAIGTYSPSLDPTGKPNPVVSSVLKGETFIGRAFVVNKWYETAYEPIYSNDRQIIAAKRGTVLPSGPVLVQT